MPLETDGLIFEMGANSDGFKSAFNEGIADANRLKASVDKLNESLGTYTDEQLASTTRIRQGFDNVTKAVENLQKVTGKPIHAALDSTTAITGIQKLSDSIEGLRAKMISTQGKLIEEKDISKVAKYNKEIQLLQTEITKMANAGRQGFDEIGNAIKRQEGLIERLQRQAALYKKGILEATNPANITKYNQKLEETSVLLSKLQNKGRAGFDIAGNKIMIKAQEEVQVPIKRNIGLMETLTNRVKLYEQALQKATSNTAIVGLNKKIEETKTQITALGNSGKTGFNEFGVAIEGAATKSNVLGKSFSFLRNAAYLIPGIGLAGIFNLIGEAAFALGEKIFATKEKLDAYIASQKDLNDALASSEYSKAIENVNNLKTDIQLAKEGVLDKTKVLKEYNDTIGKTTGQVKSLDEAELALGRNAEAYVLMTLYKAAAQIASAEAAKKMVEAEQIRLKNEKDFANAFADSRVAQQGTFNATDYDAETKRIEDAQKKRKAAQVKIATDAADVQKTLADNFRRYAANVANGYGYDLYSGKEDPNKTKTAKTKSEREFENVYRQKLLELKEKLAGINASVFTSDDTIKAKVAAEVAKGNAEYDRLLKEKKLTSPEAKSLKALNSTVGKAEIDKELKAFNEKRKASQKQIDDELEKLRGEDVQARIANIKGEFEQEAAVIQLEYEKQRKTLSLRKDNDIDAAKKNNALGFLSDDQLLQATSDIEQSYDKLYADLDAYRARKEAELSQKSLNRSIQGITKVFEPTRVSNSEETTKQINSLTSTYLKGEITYKDYQENLTSILRAENKIRIDLDKDEIKEKLKSVNEYLKNVPALDDKAFVDGKKAEQLALRKQLDSLERSGDADAVAAKKAKQDKELATLQDYVTAYTDIVTPILNFWQAANEAESKSLDRSIAIQQRRVDAAQRIADRGNATYLKMEEDKMNDLRVKQEANAKRQISINAAIQASSALTAVISGVAKAVITGNPLDAIAAVGSIIAAIGAGYQLVKSIQQNQIGFYEGTEDTGPGGKVDHKGGFHAVLHPNERVITAEQNKKLKGITNEQLVETIAKSKELIESYRTPALPELNYDRLEHAAHFHVTYDGRLAAMMEEISYKHDESLAEMKRFNKNIRNISNNVSIDRNGVKVMLMAAVNEAQINKKV